MRTDLVGVGNVFTAGYCKFSKKSGNFFEIFVPVSEFFFGVYQNRTYVI